VINEAQAERAVAKAELDNAPAPKVVTDAEVYAMIDSLEDVGSALSSRRPERLSQVHAKLDLELRYHPHRRAVDASITPRVVKLAYVSEDRVKPKPQPVSLTHDLNVIRSWP
jgi:hypothetical protein